jgi:hypothetical protein
MFISPNITQEHGNISVVIIFQEVEEGCNQLQRDSVNFQRFDRNSTFFVRSPPSNLGISKRVIS